MPNMPATCNHTMSVILLSLAPVYAITGSVIVLCFASGHGELRPMLVFDGDTTAEFLREVPEEELAVIA